MTEVTLEEQQLLLYCETFASFPTGDGPTEGHHFDYKLFETHLSNSPKSLHPRELIFLPRTDSTMNEPARFELSEDHSSNRVVFLAGEQTNGTGQDGRWFSGPSDVMMTMALPRIPDPDMRALFRFAVGIAVVDTLKAQCPELPELAVKWPNDVFTRTGWQKVSGILNVSVEDTEQFAILSNKGYSLSKENLLVGVGINLGPRNKELVNVRGKPVSVEQLTDKRLQRETVVAELCCRIIQVHGEIQRDQASITEKLKDYILVNEDGSVFIDLHNGEIARAGVIVNCTKSGITLREARSSADTIFRFSEIKRIYPNLEIQTH